MKNILRILEAIITKIGDIVGWLNVVLMVIILAQVFLRYVLSYASIVLEELQWHLFSVCIMIGLSYALTNNEHVRLDLFYGGFRRRTKEWIELLGLMFLVLPWCYVIVIHGWDFVAASWRVSESSNSPAGLCCYWLIKSFLPFSFLLLFIAALTRMIRAACYLFGMEKDAPYAAK